MTAIPNATADGDNEAHNEREVTDPITSLPVVIHDFTDIELEQVPPLHAQPNQPPSNLPPNQQTTGKRSTLERHDSEKAQVNRERHSSLDDMLLKETTLGRWVDPRDTKSRMVVHTAIVAGGSAFCAAFASALMSNLWYGYRTSSGNLSWLPTRRAAISLTLGLLYQILVCAVLAACFAGVYIYFISRMPEQIPIQPEPSVDRKAHADRPAETPPDRPVVDQTTWLNAVLVTLWPIINPTLFTPLADIIEDSLQASLPHFVKAVKIADIGQGIEPVRIQQVQWLDAAKERSKGKGEAKERSGAMSHEESAELGEYVCLEMGLVYRSSLPPSSKLHATSIENRSSNPHMVLHLWTVAGIQIPFYISLHSLLCNVRIRIALTPNPPFSSLATITLLGLPHVSFSLTPLSRHLPNVMDVPILSGWVKRSIHSAMEMYVAPRSVSVDLGLMLAGGERVDTEGAGVVMVRIISAEGFRAGDRLEAWKNIIPGVHIEERMCQGDAYVTVGWGKWGKPMWSSRIINDEMEPVWDEYAFLVVSPAELNSHERLRLQLWDADKMTADDNLGNVQVDLRQLMSDKDTLMRMAQREDEFYDLDGSTKCLGMMKWEVGYFPKVALGSWLLEMHQTGRKHWQSPGQDGDGDGKTAYVEQSMEEIEQAFRTDGHAKEGISEDNESVQQRLQDEVASHEKELSDKAADIITGTPPSNHWPSGILAVRIEQIDGLEVERVRASGDEAVRMDGEQEDSGDGMPSAYCVVVINHERVYMTRTRMVTGKPYFDAGFERFIRDWHTTSVMVSVRDARLHEVDPILGVVDLPLHRLLKNRSHITDSFPLSGGIGYGRVKLSISFRAVELDLPLELQGWDTGTLEVQEVQMIQTEPIGSQTSALIDELKKCRIVACTSYARRKLVAKVDSEDDTMTWEAKRGRTAKLAVRKRYASCVVMEFRKRVFGPDQTPAFCVLWLKEIPDDEEVEVVLPIQLNSNKSLARAQRSAAQEISELVNGMEMRVKVKFWPGLSGYHKQLAKKEKGVGDVMEVLDCVEEDHGRSSTGELLDSGSSSSSSSSSDHAHLEATVENGKLGGVVTQLKDYQKRKGQLHRKHRGLMQWSGARNVKWAVRQAESKVVKVGEKAKEKVTGRKHAKKVLEMETEV